MRMRLSRKSAAALAVVLAFGSVSIDSYGAVMSYTSKSSTSTSYSKSYDEEYDEEYGPGYLSQKAMGYLDEILEETEKFSGPGVNKVTLYEQYHEDYKIYEESIADLFFIYTTVSNGGMTDEDVTIDIPANVLYTMEKDGTEIAYTSGQTIRARGTYVLRLTAVENPELPLSEQTEYQAVFRFRIQDKPPEEETEAVAGWNDSYVYDQEAEPENEVVYVKEPEEIYEPWDLEETTESEGNNENVNEDQPETEDLDETSAKNVYSQTYDPKSGKYTVVFENGTNLTANVPNGYVGSASVQLIIDDEQEAAVDLYKNDEKIAFENGNSLSESGVYRLAAGENTFSFMIASSVSHMDYYPAPSGMKFTAFYLGSEPQFMESDQQLVMKEDGTYTIFMEGEAGEEIEVVLIKDTEVPEVSVTVGSTNVSIQYISDDIDEIILEKDGELVEGFDKTTITDPGKYRLTVKDRAGNAAVQEFVLKYQVNGYGIAAVLLCIAVVAGGAVFVVHTKKNMKIR